MLSDLLTLVRTSLPHFVPEEASEESVHAVLVADQIPDVLATQLVLFIPIAFGRVFLRKFSLIHPATFILHQPNGEVLSGLAFYDEPVYQAALQVAEEAVSSGNWKAEFHFEIAAWSPEINVVSQALAEGCKPATVTIQELNVYGDIGIRLPTSN